MEDQTEVFCGKRKVGSSFPPRESSEKQPGSIEAEQNNQNERVKCRSGKS
jgi:hypothetical protein